MAINEEGIRYLRENFQASDWLAVFLQNQGGHIIQRFTTAQRLAKRDVQAWLDYKNRQGYKVCVAMNALTPGVESRRKQDVTIIRHLCLDVDHDGPQVLAKIVQSEKTPTPNYVLETSPGKYQVIWKVEGIAKAQAEVLLRGSAQEYGADPPYLLDTVTLARCNGCGAEGTSAACEYSDHAEHLQARRNAGKTGGSGAGRGDLVPNCT